MGVVLFIEVGQFVALILGVDTVGSTWEATIIRYFHEVFRVGFFIKVIPGEALPDWVTGGGPWLYVSIDVVDGPHG